MPQKFCITIPPIQSRTRESAKLIRVPLRSFGSVEANRCTIPAFHIWFERLRRLVTLFFLRVTEQTFAAAFTSFSPCRGSFWPFGGNPVRGGLSRRAFEQAH